MTSIRARAVSAQRARERHAALREREAAERAALEEYTREFLTREAAAAHIGVSVHKLRRMMADNTSPAFIKFGDTRQATVRFPRPELEAFMADRAVYLAERPDRMAAWARVVADDHTP